jgi:aminoglycoside phosphotransferase (APT) family kinase protein
LADTIPVRSGEELVVPVLEKYLREHIQDLPDGELKVTEFGSGHSNLTYNLQIESWEAVLRRPPYGPLPPKAHDMLREYRILKTLNPFFPAAPKPYLFSDDESIVGSPFFVMERKHGIVLDTSVPDDISETPELWRQVSQIMVDELVHLHEIPYEETDLVHMTKPEGFMERQVAGWIARYERSKTEEHKEAYELTKWLTSHVPNVSDKTVIHYDYKLNNLMFSSDFTKMVGLFDWEMATVGDPLSDLGVAMSYWFEAADKALLNAWMSAPSVTIRKGFMTRREFIEAYASKSGRDVSNMQFYIIFAYFKLAVIVQQIYYRFVNGQTNDPRFAQMGGVVRNLIRYAEESTLHKAGGM